MIKYDPNPPIVSCQKCGMCTYSLGNYNECPVCARLAGRKVVRVGCPHHEDKPDPNCWTSRTNHCSRCRRPVGKGETMYQHRKMAQLHKGKAPTWCASCKPIEPSRWDSFEADPAVEVSESRT